MATRKPRTTKAVKAAMPEPKPCPDCSEGQIAEAVRVGHARYPRTTGDQQAALCLTCLGTGSAPDD